MSVRENAEQYLRYRKSADRYSIASVLGTTLGFVGVLMVGVSIVVFVVVLRSTGVGVGLATAFPVMVGGFLTMAGGQVVCLLIDIANAVSGSVDNG